MTIREVAKSLGLAKTTVAAALRDSARVSAATRALVQKRALELGYAKNPLASGFLQQVRSQGAKRFRANLAFVMPMHGNFYYQKCLGESAVERARQLGYSLDIFRADSYEPEKLTQILLARGVLGVLVGPLDDPIGQITLDWSRFATAAYGYTMAQPSIHRVVPHHLSGIREVFERCRANGFKRIGLAIPTESNQRSNRLWSAGYTDMQQALPASRRLRPFLVPEADYSEKSARAWLLKEKPDVVILQISSDPLWRLKWARGLPCVVLDRLPGDALAGIDQRFGRCGALLVDQVSAQVLHNQRGIPETPMISLVEGVWVDHPSFQKSLTRKIFAGR